MKKTLIIISAVASAFFFFIVLPIITSLFSIKGQINSIVDANKENQKEQQRISELPKIKGVIITNNLVTNPVSHHISALYALRVGAKQKTSGGRVRGGDGYQDYSFSDCVIDYPKNTQLLVNGKLYPIYFDKAIIVEVGRTEKQKKGVFVEELKIQNITHDYITIPEYINYKSFDSIRRLMRVRVEKLRGKHKIIDSYLNSNEKYGVDILLLKEYTFNTGDTIVFRGEIKENTIIPLF
ncbi:hypothetical protein ACQY1Q_10545 [Tenacibaculum sp. TC6]|uniref:hypothetical protein n=1 Tax=Tenacibaculum sp. TC6 TaxID=3423223 RepID=UPI003D35F888